MNDSIKECIKKAKRLEEKFKVRVSVVAKNPRSPMPFVTYADGATIFVEVPEKNHKILMETIRRDEEFAFAGIKPIYPPQELADLVKKDPKVIEYNMGGLGFIPPFFFHTEVYGNYAPQIKRLLEKNFSALLKEQIEKRLTALGNYKKTIQNLNRKRKRQLVQRATQIIGPIEERELKTQLERIAEEVKREKGEVLIAFDKSGRPVGTMLKKILANAHGLHLQLFFIDPSLAKKYDTELNKRDLKSKETQTQLIKQLAQERPHLIKAIKGKRVILVDDQAWQGHSFSGMNALLKKMGAKKVANHCLSVYPASPQPSWRIQGIHPVKKSEGHFISQRIQQTKQQRQKYLRLRQKMNTITKRVTAKIKARKTI
jgi:pyrimidine operon attenuation protein/uracil phosphoribosyltransferase